MPKSDDLDVLTLHPRQVYALAAAARARAQYLKGQNTDQRNTARAIEESIREGLLGETMLSPEPAYSAHIDRRGRELAGLAPESLMVDPDEDGLEPEDDQDIPDSA